jgi:ADP-ribose pyrophosphatase
VNDDGATVLLVRQYRGPIDRNLLEIPAGLCDVEGEELEATARRELVEEVGREAESLQRVAGYFPSAGFSDQFVTLYVATGLTEVPHDRQGPEEAHMTVEAFALADVDAAIADGTIADSKTLIGLLIARDRLAGR